MRGLFYLMSRIAVIPLLAAAGCNVNGSGFLPGESAVAEPPTKSQSSQPLTEVKCRIPEDVAEINDRLLRMINIERFEQGILSLDSQLSDIAAQYACTMINEEFFGHKHPKTEFDVAQRLVQAGFAYKVVGENLAAGYWDPQGTLDAWLASDSHREILMDPEFTRAGLAVRYGGPYGVYSVLILADPVD